MDNNLRLAKEIMSHVGGVGNIASLNHCSTRLRLRVNHEESTAFWTSSKRSADFRSSSATTYPKSMLRSWPTMT